MRYGFVGVIALTVCGATPALSQEALIAAPTFFSASDIAVLVARARSDPRAGKTVITLPMARLGQYRPNLDYRSSVSSADLHVKEGEFFYVVQGAGTFTSGGKLVRPVEANGAAPGISTIEGGIDRKVGAGDFFVVPENTPHWFSAIDGELVVISMHVPRPPAIQ